MLNVEQLNSEKMLVVKCAQLLNLDMCSKQSKGTKVILTSGEVFDPVNNMSDWGLVINTMISVGFDFALDQDGIIVHGPGGMVTFNDANIGRCLTKAFVELSNKQVKKPVHVTN